MDIGEVDLIVNYDTLKSPIRMIQRVGRTGRKRTGRVVCLVSEGAEQNALNQSKQSERNLAKALRKTGSFQVSATIPLLPAIPVLKEKNMLVLQKFHASQVEGHGGTANGSCAKVTDARISKGWRLSEDTEARRAAVMGSSNRVSLSLYDGIPRTLTKQLLNGRLQRSSKVDRRLSQRLGRNSRVLQIFESQSESIKIAATNRKPRRALNSTENYVNTCFPLIPNENRFEAVAWDTDSNRFPRPHSEKELKGSGVGVPREQAEKAREPLEAISKACEFDTLEGQFFESNHPSDGRQDEDAALKGNPRQGALSNQPPFTQKGATTVDGLVSRDLSSSNPTRSSPVFAVAERRTSPRVGGHATGQDVSIPAQRKLEQFTEQCDDFRLPTPTSSSDEECDEDIGGALFDSNSNALPTIPEETLFLPSQDTSSDESEAEEAIGEKGNTIMVQEDGAQVATNYAHSNAEPEKSNVSLFYSNGIQPTAHNSISKVEKSKSSARIKARKRRVFDDSPDIEKHLRSSSNCHPEARKCREEEANSVSKTARKIHLDSKDSPQKYATKACLSAGSKSSFSVSDQLVDTQDSPAAHKGLDDDVDIVCAICASEESPSEDPIVLCDGPGRSVKCDVAVHASCYAIPMESLDEEYWRCQACQYRFRGGTITPRCYICHEPSGPLSGFLGNEWIHKSCQESAGQPEPSREGIPENKQEDQSDPERQKRRRRAARALRKERYGNYFDESAAIASGEDEDGDEADERLAREIEEEEEFHKDFINDSTQLGYTQDELDRIDPDRDDEHRVLDAERAMKDTFATPVLNRQMGRARKGRLSDASSVPSEVRGLGQMHFIRSVIEHHRQGGDADAIEQAYHEAEAQATQVDDTRSSPPSKRRRNVFADDSDSE